MSFEWRLYVRDAAGKAQGEIKQYKSCKLLPVYNDVGTWSLTVDRRSDIAAMLDQPGWGVIARRGSVSPVEVLTGPGTRWRHSADADRQELQIDGVTDEIWLKRRNAHPSPADSVPPYDTQASDNRTGVASTVIRAYVNANAATGAIPQRQVPGLTVDVDPAIGATVSGSGRYDNLLTLVQTLATSGGVGFRVVNSPAGLVFQVFQPQDLSATIKFSLGLRNMAAFSYEYAAPDANYVYVGGTGTGAARVIKEYPDSGSVATWGRVEGDFVNRSDTSDNTQLQQAGTDALTQGQESASLSITPLETPTQMYGVHYRLGDKVTVQLEGTARTPYNSTGQIVDILRSVEINLTPDSVTVTPSIGTGQRNDLLKAFRFMRAIKQQVSQLGRQ